jgi:hypothetical protein
MAACDHVYSMTIKESKNGQIYNAIDSNSNFVVFIKKLFLKRNKN